MRKEGSSQTICHRCPHSQALIRCKLALLHSFVLRGDLLSAGILEAEMEQSVKTLSSIELAELHGHEDKVNGPF